MTHAEMLICTELGKVDKNRQIAIGELARKGFRVPVSLRISGGCGRKQTKGGCDSLTVRSRSWDIVCYLF